MKRLLIVKKIIWLIQSGCLVLVVIGIIMLFFKTLSGFMLLISASTVYIVLWFIMDIVVNKIKAMFEVNSISMGNQLYSRAGADYWLDLEDIT